VPSVIGGRAVAVGHVSAAATAARRILAPTRGLLVGGLLGLVRPIGGAHVCGEGLLARDASVSVVVVVHNHVPSISQGVGHLQSYLATSFEKIFLAISVNTTEISWWARRLARNVRPAARQTSSTKRIARSGENNQNPATGLFYEANLIQHTEFIKRAPSLAILFA
jgi:hypothetical protein